VGNLAGLIENRLALHVFDRERLTFRRRQHGLDRLSLDCIGAQAASTSSAGASTHNAACTPW